MLGIGLGLAGGPSYDSLGLVLDRAFEDLGRSGFHGANRKYGQFGAYLKMGEEGIIKRATCSSSNTGIALAPKMNIRPLIILRRSSTPGSSLSRQWIKRFIPWRWH
jgi:hypothetical protein